jgi:hypothetical protein
MPAINSLESEADAIKAHQELVVDSFNKEMRPVRASLRDLAEDPLKSDTFKLHAARLINQVVSGVMACQTEEDLTSLDDSLSSTHALMGSREIRAIVAAAGNLDPDQQALILRTIGGVSNGNLELQANGAAVRPRSNTSQQTQTQPATAGTGQGQQAQQTGQVVQQPASTAPSQQPATASQGQAQQPAKPVVQQPTATQQAPAQGTSTQQAAGTQQTQTQPATAGTGQGQQAQQTGQAQQPAKRSFLKRNPR